MNEHCDSWTFSNACYVDTPNADKKPTLENQSILDNLNPENVPLGTGPPTKEELLVYYPARFTWEQLKTFVNSGDLGLLKRDKKLQARYDEWSKGVREQYGSIVNYLLNHRLQWGKPDRLSRLRSALDDYAGVTASGTATPLPQGVDLRTGQGLPSIPSDAPPYFTIDTPKELISIIMNDWPYSVPPDVEHALIWTRLPIYPPIPSYLSKDLATRVEARIAQDGLWGFTGNTLPPPSPSLLPTHLPALSEWGVTMDKLVRSEKGSEEEETAIKECSKEIEGFIVRRWNEEEWETAWFVNPPRLQSVPGLAHAHVFARRKEPDEVAYWKMLHLKAAS